MHRRVLTLLIIIALLSSLAYAVANSGYFRIRDVKVAGNKEVPTAEIIKLCGVKVGDLIFRVDKKDIIARLKSNSYIKSVNVNVKMPDELILRVYERVPVGLVPYYGSYLKIDDDGIVLEEGKAKGSNLPVLYGVELGQWSLGHRLKPKDEDLFKQALMVLKAINDTHMNGVIEGVEINGSELIMKALPDIKVKVGQAGDFEYKLNFLKLILKDIKDKGYSSGTVDLSVANPTFSPSS
ncbi:cell division protein FtsQ/DivIB [Caldanaerobius polysaccharolyticus]|uniref:cell division protein FtsQ/DivIB n=1 Tax=Caldanaerobius polysaccharolyticus TaxID=44256 RepID=UPI000478D64D|nr:FtsQ-type POTRA domain-containing protein [Caldanaerobius polysaccharolyticus]